eukprot:scaffold85961_cov26-Tisochrysis_lutea.AAC.5
MANRNIYEQCVSANLWCVHKKPERATWSKTALEPPRAMPSRSFPPGLARASASCSRCCARIS